VPAAQWDERALEHEYERMGALTRRRRRSTGRRSPPFRARSSSTWACADSNTSPSGWSRTGAPRASPSRSCSAARSPTSARSAGRSATSPPGRCRRGCGHLRSPSSAPWRRCTTSLPGFGPDRSPAAPSRSRERVPRPARSWAACAPSERAWSSGPTLRIEPLEATLPDVGEFDLLCVTSLNGARRLLECCRDARDLRGPAIAAIEPGTAQALRAGGSAADIVPPRVVAESLVQALDGRPVRRALVARAEHARDVLPRRCAHAGRRSRSWRCTGPSPSRGVGPAVTKVSPTRDQCDRAQSSCRSRSPTRLDRHCTSSFEAPARGGGVAMRCADWSGADTNAVRRVVVRRRGRPRA